MKEFIEKLIGRLEELTHDNPMITRNYILRKDAIEIVNQLAEEYNNGWIPCSEKLPKYGHTFKVWLSFTTPFTSFSKAAWWVESHFEWDNGKAVKEKPIAWMQYNVPAPYIPKQEEQKGIEK